MARYRHGPCGLKLCTQSWKRECRVTVTKPWCLSVQMCARFERLGWSLQNPGWPHSLTYPIKNAKMYAPCQGSNQTVQNDSFWSAMLLRYAVTPLALQYGVTMPVDSMHGEGLVSPLLLFVAVLICRCYIVQAWVGDWRAESYCSSWHSYMSCMTQSAGKQPTQ